MASFPSLPLWTDAYLAATGHLSFEEHGVYMMLLMTIWRAPNCRVSPQLKWTAPGTQPSPNANRTPLA